jgi:hypothetical protein
MTLELSQKFSWNRDNFAEQSREDEKIASFMADRAIAAKKKRAQKTNVKNGRKAVVLESLGNFRSSIELSSFNEEPHELEIMDPLEPVNVTKGPRNPYRWKETQCPQQVYGNVIPSDQAYVDMTLDKGESLPPGSSWVDFMTLESLADKICNEDKSFCYVSTHTVKFNDEAIWRVETRSNCNVKGTWGQSSSCIKCRVKGTLRFKLIHKGRKISGQGWNSRETREYNLTDMIRESGKARQREMIVR